MKPAIVVAVALLSLACGRSGKPPANDPPGSPDAIAPPADASVDLQRDQLEAGGADRPPDVADAVVDAPADAADAPLVTADGGDGSAASETGDGVVRDGIERDATDPLCGGPGQACCHGTECADAGCCVLGRCVAAGARCWPGVTCAKGSCGACGGLGQDCCLGGYCTASGATCGWNNKCEPCGQADTKCCVRELLLCPAPGTSCVGDHCEACGQPGQTCCDFRTCAAGGCCVDYHCVGNGGSCGTAGGACTDGRCGACGGAGQPCCGGSNCHEPGFACGEQGTCQACGGPNQPSCRLPGEEECRAGAYRVNLRCIPCGQPGTDCCPGNTCDGGGCCWGGSCVANGGICRMPASPGNPLVMHGACLGSRCGGCGRPGQPCCPPDPREHFPPPGVCDPGAACVNETCAACGGAGQPCCADNSCRGGCCVHPPDGVPGQPTCVAGGASCAPHVPGGTCDGVTGSCGACGGMAQPCCSGSCTVSNSFCYSVVCRPCGREGWPCCNHSTCDDGSLCIVNTCTRPRL